MHRVAIVGSGGAGKTTFARRLGERLGLPVIHLDEHYRRPGWVATPSREWRRRQRGVPLGDPGAPGTSSRGRRKPARRGREAVPEPLGHAARVEVAPDRRRSWGCVRRLGLSPALPRRVAVHGMDRGSGAPVGAPSRRSCQPLHRQPTAGRVGARDPDARPTGRSARRGPREAAAACGEAGDDRRLRWRLRPGAPWILTEARVGIASSGRGRGRGSWVVGRGSWIGMRQTVGRRDRRFDLGLSHLWRQLRARCVAAHAL